VFSSEFHRIHRLSAAQEAAFVIGRDYMRVSTAKQIASEIGTTTSHLRRSFRRAYGIDVAACIRHARLICALERLTEQGGKIEPIALEVGYRSKKNLYHAFKTHVGLTPAEFRRLPSDAAHRVLESIRASLQLHDDSERRY
jgi:methylphosphotriester-DNA--protein-cysteine methyltransferase